MDIFTQQVEQNVVGVSTPTTLVPEPEIIVRTPSPWENSPVVDGARWTVFSQPVGTNAFANVDERVLSVPTTTDEVSRHIQAHELTHAKISPSEQQMEKVWSKRGLASIRAMIACEELRVHSYLTHKGFETSRFVQNGAGVYVASRIVAVGTITDAIMEAVKFARTAEYDPFMNTIARLKPEWITQVKAVVKGATEIFDAVINSDDKDVRNGFVAVSKKPQLHGFRYTEHCANWVDNMAATCENPNDEGEPDQSYFERMRQLERTMSKKGSQSLEERIEESAETMKENMGWGTSTLRRGIAEMWDELRIATPMLTKNAVGSIGKKRTAAQFGKNPRRVSRLYSDPQRRIFDRVTRGTGGVILIDYSGSMSLSRSHVQEMLQNAPSATVAFYSSGRANKPNLYVIGRKGKMVDVIPEPIGGNGCDGPALEWAVKQRKSLKDPIIWVSDAEVTGRGDMYDDRLVMHCISICKKNGIYVVPNANDAVKMLNDMKQGKKVRSNIPYTMGRVFREQTGSALVLR